MVSVSTPANNPDLWGDDDDHQDEGSPFSPPDAAMDAAAAGRDDQSDDSDDPPDFCVFDIETGPQPDDILQTMLPPFEAQPPPGEFDPASVKTGNLKDKAKIDEKIKAAAAEHAARAASYAADCEQAKADHWQKFKDKAALDATTGRVVAIGLTVPEDSDRPMIIDCSGDKEAEGLRTWWVCVADCLEKRIPMVGFNQRHFDLPFLVRRSWIIGVPIPAGVRVGRYWSDIFIDLMEVWQQGSRELVSLDTLAKAFGLTGKVKEVEGVEVSGATFYKLWATNRPVAEAYLKQDLALPATLARRMGVV